MATHLNDEGNEPVPDHFDPALVDRREYDVSSAGPLPADAAKELALELIEKDEKITDLRQSLWVWRSTVIVAVFAMFISEIIEGLAS